MNEPERLLRGTPYLMEADDLTLRRFAALQEKAAKTRARALAENERIRREASEVFGPYMRATRTDLVAESNVIENIIWSVEEAREVVLKNKELLDGPRRALIESVRSDARVYEVLGLYKAHEIADEWTADATTPNPSEIRGLHNLILGEKEFAGRYKRFDNQISGSDHKTTPTFDVPRVMMEMTDWWRQSDADPILRATVVHAWLAHIHPFEDGNGRLARVLANLELARNGYPPLIVRATSDRGEYYAALAASDQGDLFPLYELFVRVISRQVKLMAAPHYVRDLIADKFLAGERDRYKFWLSALGQFSTALESALAKYDVRVSPQGSPTLESYRLLVGGSSEGNGWFVTVGTPFDAEWLLWFGYRSEPMTDLLDEKTVYPSIFISRRDRSDAAFHPFTTDFETEDLRVQLPVEIALLPATKQPICTRVGYLTELHAMKEGASSLARALADPFSRD